MNGQLLTAKEFIIKAVQEKGVEKALLQYFKDSPNKAIAGVSVSALKKQFHEIQKMKLIAQLDTINTPFELKNFNTSPELTQ